jgi:hypothetical protein
VRPGLFWSVVVCRIMKSEPLVPACCLRDNLHRVCSQERENFNLLFYEWLRCVTALQIEAIQDLDSGVKTP